MLAQTRRLQGDVLVIGTGAAGCRAAIEASEYGARVLLVCKGVFGKSGTTNLAGVVYDAAVGHADPTDNPAVQFEDTVVYGRFLGNQELVRVFTFEAIKTIYDLDRYGMEWWKTEDGQFRQLTSPGLRHPRGLYHDEETGKKLQQALVREVLRSTRRNLEIVEDLFVADLAMVDGHVAGAVGIDIKSGDVVILEARNVILATGGLGMMYGITDMEAGATGEGISMAFRAGAELIDMEMHQFFPTAFVYPESLRGIAVHSSALWVHGLKLYNARGERFMEQYYPEEKENVPRDILSRQIFLEVAEGRGTEHGGVWLDTRDIPHFDAIRKERPRTYLWKERFLKTDRFEVAPTYHYTLAGIRIDASARTTVPGLYAAGECAGGVHGANRIAGSALPDCMAFGMVAGRHAALHLGPRLPAGDQATAGVRSRVEALLRGEGPPVHDVARSLRETMYRDVGIVRSARSLEEARTAVQALRRQAGQMRTPTAPSLTFGLLRGLETEAMTELAEVIVESALLRRESRGAHYRTDYPESDNGRWLRNIVARRTPDGVALDTVPVAFSYLRPEETTLDVRSARV